ncbi:MFS transporter [Actinotalea sp. M2MS4P-6]|uniref:MFS transporter n=1 Tax=Actinotalea sp. M2MS4P-6 TaxID=2983762 RepID=UPI0021E3D7F8|nr:MFS transporter [Actinotalea sp. M2MS4P-6]MCV2395176.1 MFS transporter [Actinotalea sp. M2MS4P-6]
MAVSELVYRSSAGRWVIAVTVLGSALGFLDATVVNVALPAIGEDLGARTAGLQWVLTGYLLTLSSFILVGGAYADRFGRRRVFMIGTAWFTLASVGCALAPTVPVLVAARLLQGVGAALVTPGSLAIIESSFRRSDRSRAIGAWAGLSGVGAAAGPLVGGVLVDAGSWRWVFALNVPIGAAVLLVAARHVPESRDPDAASGLDVPGALLTVVGLGGLTYAVIAAGAGQTAVALAAGAAAVVALGAFVVREHRAASPMLPMALFRVRRFTAANLITFAVYGALGGVMFLLVVYLQVVLGCSALVAGALTVPVTLAVLVLSPTMGTVSERWGPRLPLVVGPSLVAAGTLLLSRLTPQSSPAGGVLPGVLVFGLGLGVTVTPVTSTALASVSERHSGVASGINNATARLASLLVVAALPGAAGLGGDGLEDPVALAAGFGTAMVLAAVLAAAGAVLAAVRIGPEPRQVEQAG